MDDSTSESATTGQGRRGLGFQRKPGEHWTRFAGRIGNAFGLVLLLLLSTYVLASLTEYRGWWSVATTALTCASALVALASSRARLLVLRIAAVVAIVATVLAIVSAASGNDAARGISALLQMLLLLVAAGSVLRDVLTQLEVGFRTILGAISVYIIVGLLFTFLYVGLDSLQSGPFFASESGSTAGDFLWFSITTLTTTGYGTLVPAAQPGKLLSGFEMLIGQIYLVTLIAGLVSLWRPGRWIERQRSVQR